MSDWLQSHRVDSPSLMKPCLCLPAGLDFEALVVKPKEVKDGVKLPLVVIPHGGFLPSLRQLVGGVVMLC